MANLFDLSLVERDLRQFLDGPFGREEGRCEAILRQSLDSDGLFKAEDTNRRSNEVAHHRRGAKPLSQIATKRSNISPTAASDVEIELGIVVSGDFQRMDLDLA